MAWLMCDSCGDVVATVWCWTPYGEYRVACSDCATQSGWKIVELVKAVR